MIQNILRVDDVDSCSNDDIGSSVNSMTFLDPILNDDLGIVQYQSSLASYAFQVEVKKICNGSLIGWHRKYNKRVVVVVVRFVHSPDNVQEY